MFVSTQVAVGEANPILVGRLVRRADSRIGSSRRKEAHFNFGIRISDFERSLLTSAATIPLLLEATLPGPFVRRFHPISGPATASCFRGLPGARFSPRYMRMSERCGTNLCDRAHATA